MPKIGKQMKDIQTADSLVLQKRKSEDRSVELAQAGWYHSLELPGGQPIKGFLTLEALQERWAEFPLPADLHGKRLLDIGAWDGWFTFEAERRGAQVLAVDNVEQENFRYAHRELGSQAGYEIAEVYELRNRGLEPFDYTLFLGVLYHLRHPLLALEIVCELTKDLAIVDSFVVDDDERGLIRSPIPWMEFYETDELANQLDNWVGPTAQCLLALCRSAGFARAELFKIAHRHARVACYRHWEAPPTSPSANPPELLAAVNGRYGDDGINFNTRKEEFLTCWFTTQESGFGREHLRPEVSGFGVPALSLRADGQGKWHTSFRLPSGLQPGWHEVRLRTASSRFSNPCKIAVDLPSDAVGSLHIEAVSDGITWNSGQVTFGEGQDPGYLALWIDGLSDNCDRNNVRVYCEAHRLPVDFVSLPDERGLRQVNARVPRRVGTGQKSVVVEFGKSRSNQASLLISMGP